MIVKGPVLAGVDLESGTDERLKEADALAARLGQRLVVVHALPESSCRDRPAGRALRTVSRAGAADALLGARPGRDRLQRSFSSLIVVGTHGRTGLSRVALGSTAEAVVRDAPCSVLVVRLHAA